jgi:tetratricopeptide (TPR) repeat protein
MDQGRYDEAELPFKRAIEMRERALGPDHPELAITLIGLASLRKKQSRTVEAIALYERLLSMKAKTLAPEHPELADLRRSIDALRTAIAANAATQSDAAVET